jgi:hypothetical protein
MEVNRQTASRQEARRLHQESLLRSLLHRLETAKNNGDQALVQLLEKERQELGL